MNTTHTGAPFGAPSGVPPHAVKFRVAQVTRKCDSQLCPVEGKRIKRGDKYARVLRTGPRGEELLELFHAKCYDNEFEQGHG